MLRVDVLDVLDVCFQLTGGTYLPTLRHVHIPEARHDHALAPWCGALLQMPLEEVQKLMDQTAEAKQYQVGLGGGPG